jgi:mannose-6-phosphate isomerase-like protein (cupin superfamily)
MNRSLFCCTIVIVMLVVAAGVPVSCAQEGPPSPTDTSAFSGNLFNLVQQQPLPYEQDISILRLVDGASSSATLIQVRQGVKAHYHARHDEIVYVIDGKGVMTVGDEKRAIKAGDLIYLKRGAIHDVVTKSAQPLVALSVMSPPFDGEDRIYTQ